MHIQLSNYKKQVAINIVTQHLLDRPRAKKSIWTKIKGLSTRVTMSLTDTALLATKEAKMDTIHTDTETVPVQ